MHVTAVADYSGILLSLLSEIGSILNNYSDCDILLGGDINVDLRASSAASKHIKQFMNEFNLILCNDVVDKHCKYTYFHDSLGHFSYVDFFIVSMNIATSVVSHTIVHDALCLSDHLPVVVEIDLNNCVFPMGVDQSPEINNICDIIEQLRWERANLAQYHAMTYIKLDALLKDMNSDPYYNSFGHMNE